MAADGNTNNLGEAVAISVSEDRMCAFLQLIKPDLAGEVTKMGLSDLLQSNGVIAGLNEEAIALFCEQPTVYETTPLLVAQGVPPVHGTDGYIDHFFSLENSERSPMQMEDGSVDFRELIQLNNATKGQLVAQRVLPTPGMPGQAVTGEPVPAKDGKEVRFKQGKNVVIDQENMSMYAVIDGLVTETENGKLNVFPVYEVNGDVDYHVGNIDFVGNVVIRGNILSGFKIKAAGDIRVTGGVEGAELEAKGTIDIAAGILAGNKGFVKAGIDVKTSFMQEATVIAGQDILVSQSILHSHVRAGRAVMCKGTKGLVVGGTIQAGEKIIARTVGNTMSTATAFEVGVAPELRNELQQLRTNMKTIAENVDKTEKALHILDQMALAGALTPDKLELRKKLISTRRTTAGELAAAKERIWDIESSLDDFDKAKVDISGTVYAGTRIMIGRYTRFIKDSTTCVSFRLKGGEITLSQAKA
jgi:uncharacterized protein (DUF342 family)